MIATRKRLHELVDQIPAERIPDVARYLEGLTATDDPVLRAFREAPEDDEDVTPEERQEIDEAWEDVREDRLVPHEKVKFRTIASPVAARPSDGPTERADRSRGMGQV